MMRAKGQPVRRIVATCVALAPFGAACTGTVVLGDNPRNGPRDRTDASNMSTLPGDASDAKLVEGGSDAHGDAGTTTCNCTTIELCVASRTVGGARITPDDAGACPAGRHVESGVGGTTCEHDWNYTC